MTNVKVALPEEPPVSVAVTFTVKVPPAVAVPVMSPDLLMDRPVALVEYRVVNGRPRPRDPYIERGFRRKVHDYVLEVQFTAPGLPSSCLHFWVGPSGDPQPGDERLLRLDEENRVLIVLREPEIGRHGIRWSLP